MKSDKGITKLLNNLQRIIEINTSLSEKEAHSCTAIFGPWRPFWILQVVQHSKHSAGRIFQELKKNLGLECGPAPPNLLSFLTIL